MPFRLIITKISDLLFLSYELIIGNRKLIFPTMIGLIIALTIISQSAILIESYRQKIFEEVVFKDKDETLGDILISSGRNRINDPSFFTDLASYKKIVNDTIQQADYEDYLLNHYWYSRPSIGVWVNQTWNREESPTGEVALSISALASSELDFYTQVENVLKQEGKGRLPEISSEVILIRSKGMENYWGKEYLESFQNFTLNKMMKITMNSGGDSEEEFLNKTVKIVGVLEYQWTYTIGDYYYIDDFYSYPNQRLTEYDIATRLVNKYLTNELSQCPCNLLTYPSFLQQILEELLGDSSDKELFGSIQGKLFLDPKQFDAYTVNTETAKLRAFILALEVNFQNTGFFSRINSPLFQGIREFESALLGFTTLLLLVSFPVLCIALYLVVYSFGLIRRQKQEQIGIIKTRGGSSYQILFVLIGEMIISTLIAVAVGFFISIVLADIVMRSTDYLGFLGTPIPVQISLEMFRTLILWGIFFALILNLVKIIRMSKQNIVETLIPTETQSPLWKRYYFDVIMFIVGTSTWIILMTLIRMSWEGDLPGAGFYLIYMIVNLLGLPAPFLMFFGTIMIIARLFPVIMSKLAELLWKLEGGINAFSIRNIVRHKQAANRAVLLVTLALSFSILASSLIFSLDETERLKLYYKEGADISIPQGYFLNDSILEHLNKNITHITSFSGTYTAVYELEGYIWRSYRFLFIDPVTYAETAFYDPCFKLSHSMSSLMNSISDNETILLYEGNLDSDTSNLVIGKNISIRFDNTTTSEVLSLRIGGSFKCWPTIYPHGPYWGSENYWLIGSLGLFDQLNKSNYFNAIEGKYLAKIDSDSNIEEAVELIYNFTNIMPSSPALSYKKYKIGFSRHFSLSILNSDLIICITVSVIGVIMFAFFTYIERGKEIGVERAIGMTRLQTAQSFLVEATMILTFGIIIGYLTGAYFVTMFLQITQYGEQIPPVVVTYPVTLLIQMLIGIIIIAGIGTIIPAYLATRKDISRILKVE